MLTPDVRNRTSGDGLRGYERISTSWGAFAGYNWTIYRCLFLGLQGAYFNNGSGKITYNSSNQYRFHSTEWDILVPFGYVSRFGYNVYVKLGGAWVKETYKRIFAFTATGDPHSKKYRICPALAFGLGKLLPFKLNAFVEFKATIAKDTSKLTHALKDINPGPGFTDVLRNVATTTSIHFGLSKSF